MAAQLSRPKPIGAVNERLLAGEEGTCGGEEVSEFITTLYNIIHGYAMAKWTVAETMVPAFI
jgi:hypothetical protein